MASPAVEWAYEQHTLSNVTATGLTFPAGCDYALVQAVNGDARFRLDGTEPTGTVGMILKDKADHIFQLRAQDCPYARFIRDDASSAVQLAVHYRLNRAR